MPIANQNPSPTADPAADGGPAVPAAGRVVVLTGASSGIGRATAAALADTGARLVLASRSADALEAVADDCRARGAEVLVQPTDVTDAPAVQALADAAVQRFGQIDVWINNVGVGAVGLFDQTPIEAHRRVVEANLMGHIHGAHAVLPHFRQRRRGTLINMISMGGWVSAPYAAAYSASKFGLRGFSEALRAELSDAPDIHVCEVYPTFVDTPGMSHGANYSGHRVSAPPPTLDPRVVARALVQLTRRPRARVYLGAPARLGILAHALAPNLVGRSMMWLTGLALHRSPSAQPTDGNLFEPSRGHDVDGGFRTVHGHREVAAAKLAAGVGVAVLGAWWLLRRRGD